MQELKVTDEDTRRCLGHADNRQWFEWYAYMNSTTRGIASHALAERK